MRLKKSTLLVIIAVIITSICVAKVSNLIRTGRRIQHTIPEPRAEANSHRFTDGFGTTADHLMWFVQVLIPIDDDLSPVLIQLKLSLIIDQSLF